MVCVQWWEDVPSHPNLTFIRGLQPYQGEDPRGIDHTRLPAQDGPRGVGWMSGYVSGGLQQADLDVFPSHVLAHAAVYWTVRTAGSCSRPWHSHSAVWSMVCCLQLGATCLKQDLTLQII